MRKIKDGYSKFNHSFRFSQTLIDLAYRRLHLLEGFLQTLDQGIRLVDLQLDSRDPLVNQSCRAIGCRSHRDSRLSNRVRIQLLQLNLAFLYLALYKVQPIGESVFDSLDSLLSFSTDSGHVGQALG